LHEALVTVVKIFCEKKRCLIAASKAHNCSRITAILLSICVVFGGQFDLDWLLERILVAEMLCVHSGPHERREAVVV